MTAAVTNLLSVTYSGTTVGGTSDHEIDGGINIDYGYTTCVVEFRLVTHAASTSAFITNCQTLETAFTNPRQDLTITLDSTTWLAFVSSTGTGYNADPHIIAIDDERNTHLSRVYAIRIAVEVPADLSGKNYRQDSTVSVITLPNGQKTYTVSGVYTQGGSTLARAQYEAQIGTYCSSLATALGGTWELISDTATSDDDNRKLWFSRSYKQIIYNQAAGTTDHASIVNHSMTINAVDVAPGDYTENAVWRLRRLVASYACEVLYTQTTDLRTLYNNTIEPYIISQTILDGAEGGTALMSRDVQYDHANNRISATLQVDSYISGNFLYSRYSESDIEDQGYIETPVWSSNKWDRIIEQGAATYRKTTRREVGELLHVTITTAEITAGTPQEGGAGGRGGKGASSGGMGIGTNLDMHHLFKNDPALSFWSGLSGWGISGGGGDAAPAGVVKPGIAGSVSLNMKSLIVPPETWTSNATGGKLFPTRRQYTREPVTAGIPPYTLSYVRSTWVTEYSYGRQVTPSSLGSGQQSTMRTPPP